MKFKDLDLKDFITDLLNTVHESETLYQEAEKLGSGGGQEAELSLSVSDDGMEAKVKLVPAESYGRKATREDILNLLKEKNVVYGIMDSEITNLVLAQTQTDKPLETVVAIGKPFSSSRKKFLELSSKIIDEDYNFFEEAPSAFFRSLDPLKRNPRYPARFKKDEVIARIDFSSVVEDACDVFGKSLKEKEEKKGSLITFSANPGVVFLDSNGKKCQELKEEMINEPTLVEVLADKEGDLLLERTSTTLKFSILDTRTLSVIPKTKQTLFIKSNVVVKANILESMELKCNGNVFIRGNVVGGKLLAGGDVFIYGKVMGDSSKVKAKGSIYCLSVERGECESEEDIFIENNAQHSQLRAGKSIYAGFKGGLLAGGFSCAGNRIYAHQIGNSRGLETHVAIDPKMRFLKTEQLLLNIRENLTNALEKMDKIVDIIQDKKDSTMFKLSEEESLTLQRVYKQKLDYEKQIKTVDDKIKALQPLELSDGSEKYKKGIYAGEIFANTHVKVPENTQDINSKEKYFLMEI
ncbi:FapA family protein [Candidatus Riflebacteria bacterium]